LRQRVRGTISDPLLARLRLENLLGNAEVRLSGLPPSAILCLRTLHDPMPGTLRLSGYSSRLPQQWELALTAALEDHVRHAVRPLVQPVPANAEAVLFVDRAEMLACLALDWAKGMLGYHWWWRSFLRDYDEARAIWSVWLDTPHYIPAALAHVAAQGEVVPVVRRLSEKPAADLLGRLLETFNLRDLAAVIAAGFAAGGSAFAADSEIPISLQPAREAAPSAGPPRSQRQSSASPTADPAPWADQVPESHAVSLTPVHRLLVGISLSLVRDPARVRTRSFALETRRWLHHESAAVLEQPAAPLPRASAVPPTIGQFEEGVDQDDFSSPASAHETAADETRAETAPAPPEHRLEAVETPAQPDDAPLHRPVEVIGETTADAAEPKSGRDAGTPVDTALGGIFYLLNLGVYLGFYSDYSTPWKQELDLPIWDFVTIVGQELLGDIPPDPVWGLLAQLAGRGENTPPGQSFVPPDAWHIDPQWLAAFPATPSFDWWAANKRLRVLHPAGFLVLDTPLDGDPAPLLDDARTHYGINLEKNERRAFPTPSADPLRRWLDWLMPYIQIRLRRALGLGADDDPAPMLCQHHARVYVTPTHLDVLLNLDTLPIEIRLAGLDRSPGWLPAAGRMITFHFEQNGG
jgi:hypothetical protein